MEAETRGWRAEGAQGREIRKQGREQEPEAVSGSRSSFPGIATEMENGAQGGAVGGDSARGGRDSAEGVGTLQEGAETMQKERRDWGEGAGTQ